MLKNVVKLTTFLKRGFYFCFLCVSGWEGCLSVGEGTEVQESDCHKNGKPINEDKRQKTWGLDLETSSELELDGG